MKPIPLTQLTLGALVTGASILSGNALLLAVAGGIGVEWAAAGLEGLWQDAAAPWLAPGSSLARAYERALGRAARDLKGAYERRYGPVGEANAFDLIEGSAASLADVEYSAGATDPAAVQLALGRHLEELLHGHDPRQVTWLRTRLLDATAAALQRELERDAAAGDAFRTWLVQQMAAQTSALAQRLAGVPAVLEALQQPQAVLGAIDASEARLQAELQALRAEIARKTVSAPARSASPPATSQQTVFDNRGMQVQGDVQQVAGNQYTNSAHAEGAGSMAVKFGGGPPPSATPPASAQDAIAILEGNLDDCRLHLIRLQRLRDGQGLNPSDDILHRIDYYERRVFELETTLDALNAAAGK